ncbi:MAG: hypothetical protein H0V81_12230 [Solirubrobacterales bacterium]|nr:hypothetical protein [Solirubrobacterales bacterium]
MRVGKTVIGADVVLVAEDLDAHRFPVFGFDETQQCASARRLAALRDQGLAVLPGHDAEVLRPGPVATGE